jgi:hypothetical protein
MLKVKKLLELVALEALIRGVREHAIQRKLYTLPDRSLLKVKQVMKNHIRVEDANLLRYRPFFFIRITNMKDLTRKIILLVEMKDQERIIRDQPMDIYVS